MAPAESLELAALVADLTTVIDGVAPPVSRPPSSTPGLVGTALTAFEQAWTEPAANASLAEASIRVAAAGMALVEGDPRTVRQLIDPQPRAAEAA